MKEVCGFVPAHPRNGAYGHWRCQRQKFHFGSHRFNNYVIRRVRWRWAWAMAPIAALRVLLVERGLRRRRWFRIQAPRDRAFHRACRYEPLPVHAPKVEVSS